MDWQNCMNQAMDYVENNLTNTIDYSIAAQYVSCSEWEFRRMFSFLTQMPLSEYVRRRRLTEAVKAIQNGEKLIDVAQKYGYESQAAFSRAFKQQHGITPFLARSKGADLKAYPRLFFKFVLREDEMLEKASNYRKHIMGGKSGDYAVAIEMDQEAVHNTNEKFWDTLGTELVGGTALPDYGAFVSEEKCQLFREVSGKKVLEIGCGTGHSLAYLGKRKAAELWGLDISKDQIEKANCYLAEKGLTAQMVCSPMEVDCGLPENYFDYVYSVYGIGWATDLDVTFRKIASYLKKDGQLIFSWSHPIHKCVSPEEDMLVFKKSYFDESWYTVSLDGGVFSLADRKMSTYVNALARAGFCIEELIEQSDEDILQNKNTQFAEKAKMLPVTFVIKARKL